jgi:hypothetical protein
MTRSDAKQKWCPMARGTQGTTVNVTFNNQPMFTITGIPAAAANRSGDGPAWDCKCLADGCMMWRQHGLDRDDGHCGLAGFAVHGE